MVNSFNVPPPDALSQPPFGGGNGPDTISLPIVHKIFELYKNLYLVGAKMAKSEKLGIWTKLQNLCLEILELSITAALTERANKKIHLQTIKIKLEVVKNILRLANELSFINSKTYLLLSSQAVTISIMANRWQQSIKEL